MTTNKFFDTKEQYLAFRKAFAAAQNSPRAKSSLVDGTADVWDPQTRKYSKLAIKTKQVGWLQAEHFALLNVIRGKPVSTGFTPKTKPIALANGYLPYQKLHFAVSYRLSSVVNRAKEHVQAKPIELATWQKRSIPEADQATHIKNLEAQRDERNLNFINAFLEPFTGTITVEQLAKLTIPEMNAVDKLALMSYSDFVTALGVPQ